jgi:hypothetical protein
LRSALTSSMPTASARPRTTASVAVNTSSSMTKRATFARVARRARSIASAALVASSSIEEFAIGRPVRSAITVW